jgi:hypothetical protein
MTIDNRDFGKISLEYTHLLTVSRIAVVKIYELIYTSIADQNYKNKMKTAKENRVKWTDI